MTENIKTMVEPANFVRDFKDVLIDAICCDESELTPNANLTYLGMDSLDIFEIIMRLERKFGVDVPDSEFTSYTNITVAELLNKFTRKLIENGRFPKKANIITIYQSSMPLKNSNGIKLAQKALVPKSLIDEYNATAAKLRNLERQIQQYTK